MPSIGADEKPLLPIDAGVSDVIAPTANAIVNEGASIPVTVEVTNFGTDTIFGMNVQYSVNNGTPVSVAYSDTLLPFASDTVVMPNFSATAGNSSICAKTVLLLDSNLFNDEFCQPFFGTPTKDAYLTQIADNIEEGCGLGSDTIMIWIRNVGIDTINGPTTTIMTASYQVDSGATTVTENMTLTINPGDSALFVFNTLANFAVTMADSIFDVVAWVNLTGDNVAYNDTAYRDVESLVIPAAPVVTNDTIPYATSTTISAVSPTGHPLTWFIDDTTSVVLGTGPTYTTPILYDTTTYWVQAGQINAGPSNLNIAPLAIASASTCNTGPCSTLNDLNFGTCGSQQMWISTYQ